MATWAEACSDVGGADENLESERPMTRGSVLHGRCDYRWEEWYTAGKRMHRPITRESARNLEG